jgi:hypothetical protein
VEGPAVPVEQEHRIVQHSTDLADVTVGIIDRGPRLRRFVLSRREIFIWIAVILFANQLADAIKGFGSTLKLIADLGAISIFQYMAWWVVYRFLWSSDGTPPAGWRDLLAAGAFSLLILVPTGRMIWVAATGLAGYLCVFNDGDRRLRSAGIVLAALSVQELWGHLFFNLIALHLLRIETAAVGIMLEASKAGWVWNGNIITGPSGFGIVVFRECSSFHNLSLALLCWVTVTTMRCRNWRRGTLLAGASIGAVMIALNFVRLYLMALNVNSYNYWHHGMGAQIFAVGASLTILLLSLFHTRAAGHEA